MGATSPGFGHHRDSLVQIVVSEDALHAYADFLPSFGDGEPLTEAYVRRVLRAEGIDYGVDEEAIARTVESCNAEHEPHMNLCIASGRPPVRTNPERLILTPRFERARERLREGYRDIPIPAAAGEPLGIVLQGETVATMQETIPGIDGVDVYNRPIPCGSLQEDPLSAGEGTRFTGERLEAGVSGLLCLKDAELHVEATVHIDEVGSGTGNIRFPGNVVITGRVQDGRRLWIGGGTHVKTTLDAHEVFVRGALQVDAGIIGRGRALVRCGGQVAARFIELCNVETKQGVHAESLIYGSSILSLDTISTGDSGEIIGGSLRATGNIHAGSIGNQANVRTELMVGVNFVMERKLQYARRRFQELTLLKQRLEADGVEPEDLEADGREKGQQERYRQVLEAREKYSALMGDMLGYLDANESAEIVAHSAVYAGTELQICRARHTVTEDCGPSRFYLNKELGRIQREDL